MADFELIMSIVFLFGVNLFKKYLIFTSLTVLTCPAWFTQTRIRSVIIYTGPIVLARRALTFIDI